MRKRRRQAPGPRSARGDVDRSEGAGPPILEELEPRILLSTFTLANPADLGGESAQEVVEFRIDPVQPGQTHHMGDGFGAEILSESQPPDLELNPQDPSSYGIQGGWTAGTQVIGLDGSVDQAETGLGFESGSGGTTLRGLAPDLFGGAGLSQSGTAESRSELVFVDTGVADYETLVDDLRASIQDGRSLEVFLLDTERDGIEQISDILADYQGLDAIHIVSHGTEGAVRLGDVWLSGDTLSAYESDLASWGDALSEDADLLFYGCDLAGGEDGEALVGSIAKLTGADVAASVDATGAAVLGGDWDLEHQTGVIETAVAVSAEGTDAWQALLDITTGSAIWAENGSGTPGASDWDGTTFGAEGTTANVGSWRTMQGAEAPTRDEKIVVGIEAGGTSTGMMWDGSSWSALSLGTLGSVSETYWYGAEVAYESQSGDAMLVWNDSSQAAGDELRFSVWDGTSWTTPNSISAFTGTEPQNMKLVSSPTSDEMVLVVSDASADDHVLVWNGSSWGNALMLDASGTGENDQSGIALAYESQSGDAMVVYGKDNDPDAYYRIWNGSSWGTEQTIDAPGGVSDQTRWTSIASDPTSDRLVLGTMTSGSDVWLTTWDGSAWAVGTVVETSTTGLIYPNMDVAFESQSGEAIAVYGESGQSVVRYRTWSAGGGWSAEQTGPSLDATPNSMTLDSDPASNRIMLSVQDSGADLNMALWDGSSFGAVTEHETDTGETKNQPFVFLWDQDYQNVAPVNTIPGDQTTPQDTPLVFTVNNGTDITLSDADAAGSEIEVTLSVDNGTLTLDSTVAVGSETRLNSTTSGLQSEPDVAYAADGSYVTVWQDSNGLDGDLAGVYGQRFHADGNKVGGEFLVNTTTASSQFNAAIAMDDAGNFTVAFTHRTNGGSTQVYAQRFDSLAVKQGGQFTVNNQSQGNQYLSDVAMDPSGNFVISWYGNGAGDDEGVFIQRYDAAGNELGGETLVNTMVTDDQQFPRLAMNDAGDFVVVWQSTLQDGSGTGIYGQRFDSSGVVQGAEFLINTTTASSQMTASVSMDATGNFVVVWQSNLQDGSGYGVFGQRYDSAGNAVGAEFQINETSAGSQLKANVAMTATGEFVVAWAGQNQAGDGSDYAIVARRYDSTGSAVSVELLVNTTTSGAQSDPNIDIRDNGDFVVAWSGNGPGDADGVFSQRFTAVPLTFSVGDGIADAEMTFRGTVADINTALEGMTYTPSAGYNGVDTLTITTDDLGNTGAGGALQDVDVVSITVGNPNASVINLDANDSSGAGGNDFATSWTEGTGAVLIVDADGTLIDTDENLTSLVVSIANLRQPGIELLAANTSGTSLVANYDAGTGVLTISGSGTAAEYQQVLRTVNYDSTSDAPDTTARFITFTATDAISNGNTATTTLTIQAANDAPVNTVPGAQSTAQDTDLVFSTAGGNAVTVSDADANGGDLEVTLSVTQGTLSLEPATPAGGNLLVNGTTTDSQSLPAIAVAADGSWISVWHSNHQDGLAYDIYAQRFDADGNAIGSEFLVNTVIDAQQTQPAVAVDAAGNFVIVWQSSGHDPGNRWSVFGQRYDANGNALGSEFQINSTTSNDQNRPDIAMDVNGNFVVTWDGDGVGDADGIFARRYDSAGDSLGSEFLVNTHTTDIQDDATIAMDDNGNFVVVWISDLQDGDGLGVYGQLFDASGAARGSEFRVAETTTSLQYYSDVAMDADGDFVVTWHSSGQGLMARTYDATGVATSGEFDTGMGGSVTPSIAMDADGNFTITRNVGTQVVAQSFDSSGTPRGDVFQVSTTAPGVQPQPVIGMNADGEFVIAWDGTGSGDTSGIIAQRYSARGLTFTAGDGTSDSTMTFTGTMADVNTALEGLAYTPDTGFNGVDTLTITTNDLGNTGTGGAQADIDTVDITVGTVPSVSISGADTTLAGSAYTLNLISTQLGITSWTINWGDGTAETIAGSPSSVTHIYTGTGFTYNILAAASDGSSTFFESELLVPSYTTNDGLVRYTPTSGDFLQQFATGDGLTDPYEVIVGPDGNTYVTGFGSDNVLRYDPSGNFIDEFVTTGSGGLDAAVGLAFGPDGNLYVSSYNTNSVLRYDGTTGAFIDSFASGGGLSNPMSVAFGADGSLYAVGFSSNNVVRYDGTTGAFIDVFVTSGSGGLNSPEDMAFGPDGNLYITSPSSNEVLRYNGTTGAFIDVFTSGGSLNGATGLAFSPDGHLYVSSYYGDTVQRFDATTGVYVDDFFTGGSGGLDGPTYLNFVPGHQVTVVAAPPTAVADAASVDEGASVVIDLAGNDTDPDSALDLTSIVITSGPATGSLFDNGDGTVTYTHDGSETVSDSFSYTLDDVSGATSNAATVTLTVNPINDDPFNAGGLPSDLVFLQDTQGKLDLSAMDLSDVDAGAGNLTLTITSDNGHLQTLGWPGVTLGGSQSQLVLTGSLTDLNDFLNDTNSIDYEHATPGISGDNVDRITIQINDNGNTGSGGGNTILLGSVNIDITSTNADPVITSNGGGATANFNVAENATAVTTVTATDPDLDTPTFSITGGVDQALFSLNASSGTLTFNAAPDFEVPADANGDNVYEVTVQVDDGNGGIDTQALSVTVTDVATNLVVTTMADLDDGDTSSAEALNASKGVDGAVSLSEAITAANNSPETVTISFNITDPLVGGVHTFVIAPGGLPAITSPVIIDATTEPDYSGTPIIELDGSSAGAGVSGLTLGAGSDGSVIRGLVINRFDQSGIRVDGSDGNTISGNYIGTDASGNVQSGSDVQATGITINDSFGNAIGGTGPGDANVLSGNRLRGLVIIGSTSTNNVVSGNFIGTNADGSAALTNVGVGQQIGVYLYDTPGNTIGGTATDAENVISGNTSYGMYAWGPNATGNAIQGNIIGLDASLSTAIGNGNAGGAGIMLSNAAGNLIGGTAAGAGNVISGHLGAGLNINAAGGTGNTVLANAIYDNGLLGIDLGADGVTGNDAGDVDAGANDLQNYPVISSAELDGTDLTLGGSLDTDGLTTQYRIEFFGNAAGTEDATNGEARVYLGSTTVTTDGSGDATFSNVTLSGVTLSTGDYVTATATKIEDAGQVGISDQLAYASTSEFAVNALITTNATPTTSGISDFSVAENSGFGFMDLKPHFADAEDPDTDLVYTIVGNTNPALFNSATIVSGSTFRLDYGEDLNGTSDITIRATDTGGLFVESTFTVTVNPVNDAPVRTAGTVGNLSVLEDSGLTSLGLGGVAYGPGGGVDESGQTLSYSVTAIPSASAGDVFLADGTTRVTTGPYTLTEIRGMQFKPADDWNGTTAFQFNVTDSGGTSNGGVDGISQFILITVDPANDAPVLGANALTITEGGTVVLSGAELSATDAETAAGLLQFTVSGLTGGQFEAVANPGVSITSFSQAQLANGEIQFIHDGGETAPTYSVSVSDGTLIDGPLAASITFTNVNDAPTAAADSDTAAEGATIAIDLAANDADPDDGLDLTSIQIASGPSNGSIVVNADGTVDYTHDGSETLVDSFTYTIRDASGAVSNTATVTLTIAAANDAPVLGSNALTISEGGTVILAGGDLSATDAETAAGLLQFTVSGVTGGQFEAVANPGVAITTFSQAQVANGEIQFVHDGGEAAPTYSVSVSDGALIDGPLAATITFTNVNDAPTAVGDSDTAAEGATIAIDLAANDTDPDNGLDLSSIQVVSGPSNGSILVNGDGTVDYTHDGSETLVDSFTYTIRDASGAVSNTATVTLTIAANNDAPVLGSNALIISEGGTVILTGSDLSATDAETAAGLLQFTVSGVTGGQFEAVANPGVAITTFSQAQVANGEIQFVHDGGESAPTYSVSVSDGALIDGPLAATITFTNVNDAPTAVADSDTAAEGATIAIDLAANDTDPDDGLDLSSIQIVSGPSNGSIGINGDGTVDYTHDGSETLADSFTYTIRDAGGAVSNTATVTLTITPVDDTPALGNNALTISEGGSVVLSGAELSASDAETAASLLQFTVSGVTGGQFEAVANPGVTITTFSQAQVANGEIQFVHDGGEAAPTYSVSVSDGALIDGPLAAAISFTNVNDAPIAVADSDTAAEGATITIDLAANDTDPDDGLDLSSIQIASGPANGSIVLNGDGTVDYTHDGSETLVDSFTYTIRDASGAVSNTATVTLTIAAANDAPVLGSNALTISEGGTVVLAGGDLSATDAETAAGLLQFTVSGVTGGQFEAVANPGVAITSFSQAQVANGEIQFVHDGGEAAPTYSVTVSDGALIDGPLAASITFTNVNDAPTAVADSDTAAEGATITIDLAANDTDPDDGLDLTSIQIASGPSNGSIVVNADGTVDYTHDGSETLADSFTYTIRDASGAVSNVATVTLTITSNNDAPVLGSNALVISEGGTVILSGEDLSATDAETAAGLLQFSVSGVTGGQFEAVANPGAAITTFSQAQVADGEIQFVHDGGEAAPTYSVSVSDGALIDGPLAATITFTNVNDAPTAIADSDTAAEGATITIDLAANDTDPDDGLDLSSIQIASGPANGSIVLNGDGTVDYTHDGSETLVDSFTYTIRDASGAVSNTATVTLTIAAANDAPVLGSNALTISEGGTVILAGGDLSATDAETAAGLLQFTVSGVTGGQFEAVANPGVAITSFSQAQVANGEIQFVHDGGEAAPTYSVSVSDGALTDGPLAAAISFTNVNDAPIAVADSDTAAEGATITIDLAANDTDPDDGLDLNSIVITSGPSNGSIGINGDGTVDYTHDGSETTTDSFTYTIRDASGAVSNTATVTLTITATNDAPVLGSNALVISEGGTVILTSGDLSATDAEKAAGLLQFTVSGVTGGQFEEVANPGVAITTFSQAQLTNGEIQFVHDGGEAAPTYSVSVSDGALIDGPLAAVITFTNVNDAPTAAADSDTAAEGATITIDLAANDSDPDDGLDLTSIQIASGPSNGSIVVNGDGTIDYTHDGSETLTDSFTYTIRDAGGAVSNTATVTLTIAPLNDAPALGNNALTISEGGTVVLAGTDLAAADAETAAGLLQFTVSGVSGGQFEEAANPGVAITTFTQQQITNGEIQFVHAGGEAAPTYSVTVSDGALVDGPLAATITFTNVNDAPTAMADSDTAAEGSTITIDLAANDADPDDGLDLTSIQIVSGPTNGSIVINGDGTVDYTHDGSETTTDSFTYTIKDASGTVSNVAAVSLTITTANDAPVLGSNALSITEGGTVLLTGADLAATDAETAAGLLQFTVTGVTGGQFEEAANPGVAITTFSQAQIANSEIQFVHDGGEAAPTYSVTVSDGALIDGPLAASITFTNVNDAPTAVGDSDTVAEDATITIDLAANDSDPDDGLDLTSIQIASGPSNGSILLNGDGTVDYTHDGSETLTDSFTYTIRDAAGAVSNTATVSLTITPQDDNPVLANNALVISEGGTVVLSGAELSATDAETASGLLQFTVSGVTGGQFEAVANPGVAITAFTQAQVANGEIQFVHDGGEAAPTYNVSVSDGALIDGPLAATITFTNVNDAPTAVADTDTALEGATITIDLAANDTDPDNPLDLTSIQIASSPSHGSIAINGDGTVDYTHDGSETISDSFTYTIRDASGALSNTATVTLTITPNNDAPALGSNALTITEGGTVLLTGADLSATDAETAAGLLQFTVSGITGGQFEAVASPGVAITAFTQAQVANGEIQFVHDGGEAAPTYSVRVSDGALIDGPLAATITFTNVNDAPTAVADTDTALEGATITIDLAANDTDPDNPLDLTSIQIASSPSHGSIAINGDGTVDYTHDGSETISDSFTYTIRDASGALSNTATVTLTITSNNDAPALGSNALTIAEGGTVILSGTDLSATDAETAAGLLQFTVLGVTGGQFEAVANPGVAITAFTQAQVANGEIQFVHDGGEAAPTYSVSVSDGALTDGPLAATITFTNVNDAPTAVADSDTVAEGATITIDLAANDTDSDDGLDLNSIVITSGPSNGSVVINGDGTVDYTHDGSETTSDSFTYTIQDASGAVSNVATVSLTTAPANDAPALGNNALVISEGGTVILTGSDLSATDAETAAGLLQFTVSGVTGGQFEAVANPGVAITTFSQAQVANGEIQFAHDGGEAAPTYSVTVSDGALLDGPLAATITFTNVNDAPNAAADSDTAAEGATITVDLAANDTDPDDGLDLTSIEITSGPANGSIVLKGDGTVDYTHDGSETTSDSFTYTIRDASGAVSNTATVTLTIAPTNDAPVLGTNALTISEGGTVILSGGDLSATDAETASGLLQFTVSGVIGGQFEAAANPGVAINTFTQAQVTNGEIQFVHDGGEAAPSYSVTVSDGALTQGPGAAAITFVNTNDTPLLDLDANDDSGAAGADYAGTFVEGGPSVLIADVDAQLTDVDSPNLVSLTATITNLRDSGMETLTADTSGTAISAAYDSVAGVLQLSGLDSRENYQQVLRTITYENLSQAPDATTRSIAILADDGVAIGNGATSSISITPVNDAPTASADAYILNEDQSLSVSIANRTLANDSDPDGDGLAATLVTGPSSADSFMLNPDGTFVYVPQANFSGTDQFTYVASDGAASSAMTVVSITVVPVNDAPSLMVNLGSTTAAGGRDVLESAELWAADPDDAAAQLVYSVVTSPASGQLELASNPGVAILTFSQADIDAGSVVYVHDGSASPADGFEVVLSDASGASVGPISFSLGISQLPIVGLPVDDPAPVEDPDPTDENPGPTETPEPDPEAELEPEEGGGIQPPVAVVETRTRLPWSPEFGETPVDDPEESGTLAPTSLQRQGETFDRRETSRAAQLLMGLESVVENALETASAEIQADASRQAEEAALWIQRSESLALAVSAGLVAALLRSGSLWAIAVSSLPLWKRFDPIAVLGLSVQEREGLARELEFEETLEDETSRVGRVLDSEVDARRDDAEGRRGER